MTKKNNNRVPNVIDLIFENMDINIEYNPETIDQDIQNLSNEVEKLSKTLDDNSLKYQSGELEFNVVNDSIINFLDKKQQLDYLSLIAKSKSSQPLSTQAEG